MAQKIANGIQKYVTSSPAVQIKSRTMSAHQYYMKTAWWPVWNELVVSIQLLMNKYQYSKKQKIIQIFVWTGWVFCLFVGRVRFVVFWNLRKCLWVFRVDSSLIPIFPKPAHRYLVSLVGKAINNLICLNPVHPPIKANWLSLLLYHYSQHWKVGLCSRGKL